jgi:hypothetical protein
MYLELEPGCEKAILQLALKNDLIEKYVRRKETEVPDTFVPCAQGLVVAGDGLYFSPELGYREMRRGEWGGGVKAGQYFAISRDGFFWVRKYGCFWSIERSDFREQPALQAQVLALVFETKTLPILCRYPELAKRTARSCDPHPHERAKKAGIHWVPLSGASVDLIRAEAS